MHFRKSAIAAAAVALCSGVPLAAQAAPTVSWSTPTSGATLSGTVNGSACAVNASSDTTRIVFWANSMQINNDYSAPWTCNFDTTQLRDGPYTLSAIAYNDAQGTYTTAAIPITVNNSGATSTTSTGSTSTSPVTSPVSSGTPSTSGGTSVSLASPFTGTPIALPAVIPAANFDNGGEGVAYHDLTSANLGGQYRTSEAVDIYPSTDTAAGQYQVANFQSGEWMSYTVNVPANGSYDLGIRASNNYGTGAFHIEVDGSNVTGTVAVPKTGSWTTYQWFGKQGVPLTAGQHAIKVVAETQWFNLSALSVQAGSSTSTGGTNAGGSSGGGSPAYAGTPFTGTAIALPAVLPAANFDKGGEGVAYHDLTSANLGALYRTSEAVDIYPSTDTAAGQYQVANFQNGEWMMYTVNAPANGTYDVGIRAANNYGTGAFHIEVDGTNVTGTVAVPKTGSWTTYQWFGKQGVPLTAGNHVVKLVADTQWFNVSALSLQASGSSSTGGTSGSTGGSIASKPANLLFWSGFEGPLSFTTPSDCYNNGCFQGLTGTDSSTGFSWPYNMMGGSNRFQLLVNGPTPTPDTVSTWMYNELQSVVGHKGNQTKALYSEILQSGCCGTNPQGNAATQDPFHVFPAQEPGDVYMSKWLMLQPDLVEKLAGGDPWRVVFEWKEGASSGAFRIIVSIVAYGGQAPHWQVTWDNDANGGLPYQRFWRNDNTSVRVPVGEWFKFEIFWHRASDNTGRAWVAVNGQVVDDHYGPNIGVWGTPVGRIMINQVYTGAPYPAYQWMDDIQVWKGFPTASPGDPWYDPPYAPH